MNTAPNTGNTPGTAALARRAPDVWPTFQAEDAPALIDFLVGTLGFVRTAVYEVGERVAHAQLDWPEGGGVLLSSYGESYGEHEIGTVPPGSFAAYVVTERVDELYERFRAAGVRVLKEIQNETYGSRDFVVADPEGNKWFFGTYSGEPRPMGH